MSKQDSEIESSLNNAVPLPCSIDSMQLMFDAGVEEQKRKSKKSRRLTLATTSMSCVFLVSTLAMAAWNLQLASQNSSLLATINSEEPDSADQTSSGKENDSDSREATKGSALKNKAEKGTTGQSPNQQNRESSRSTREDGMYFAYLSNSTNDNTTVQSFMLRGVALQPKDEYRSPIQSAQRAYLTSEKSEDSPGPSNLNLRPRMQSDLLGL